METKRIIKEVIQHGNSMEIKDIKIGDEDKQLLKINNIRGGLTLDLNDGETTMVINDKKRAYFSRTLYRPNHDHDDTQYYQKVVDSEKAGKPNNTLEWRTGFPYQGEGWEILYVDFRQAKASY